jgi:23S rRNA (adenine2503-C2)-methyltransferase
MACDFCATGKGGFTRNLKAYEIVDQVLTVQEDFRQRVSHVVFMGMGEPLLNIPEVVTAIHSLNQDVGIGQRCLTISTVRITP